MQKLEEIMRAEDEARHLVLSAREQADALIREAEANARALQEKERTDTAEQAAVLREEQLAAARAEAGLLTERAEAESQALLDAARVRTGAAVSAALEKLQG